MHARGFLALGPMQLLRAVFDETWEALKSHCPAEAQSIEVQRLRVANAVLAAWRSGASDLKAVRRWPDACLR
jgi:hypothetical protein